MYQRQVIPTLLWCVEGEQGRTGVEVQALVREFRQELVAAAIQAPTSRYVWRPFTTRNRRHLDDHSVVGDDGCAMQALTGDIRCARLDSLNTNLMISFSSSIPFFRAFLTTFPIATSEVLRMEPHNLP